jgi:predicted transcriptional regulator
MKVTYWCALVVNSRHRKDAYGILTESDFIYKVIVYGKDPNKVRVYEHMTKPCIVVNPELGLEYVERLFADHHLRRAPVIIGNLLGIISLTDILASSFSKEKPCTILLKQELQDEIKKPVVFIPEKELILLNFQDLGM